METVLLTRKLIGYRCWRTDGQRLQPRLLQLPDWKPGVNEAACFQHLVVTGARQYLHAAPNHNCYCGLHAYRDVATLLNKEVPEHGAPHRMMARGGFGWVLGAVAAWGQRVEVHADGFRAEFMEPIALSHHNYGYDVAPRRAEEAARKLGLRLLPLDELEGFASSYGAPLPDQLRPKAKPVEVALLQKTQAAILESLAHLNKR